MDLFLEKKKVFAYTAAHSFDPKKPALVFVHGAGLDHSWWGLQSRYFGYHGCNVLALDFPGHGRSEGPPIGSVVASWSSRSAAGAVSTGIIVSMNRYAETTKKYTRKFTS